MSCDRQACAPTPPRRGSPGREMHVTKTFRDLGVHPTLCDALERQGISHPFPIQELTLPLALEGHDLIGQARTGTGKTLAFGLPLLQRLDVGRKATQALVIVPTRELCLQVFEDLKVGTELGLTSISVYGGVGYDEQIDALTSGVHIVVGTPGRLLDHLNRGNLDLSGVTQLVLDEADEMLDMGFLPDVERLVAACQGQDRHTMLFSATMPTPIVKLARRYMEHPTFTRADYHEQRETDPNVEQHFFQVHRMDKPRLLARILQDQDRGGVYVFVRTKHMADRLVNELEDLNTPAVAIHGDLRQTTRERNLDRFRQGKATVLVATEVAARGLDVHGVTHVVNYDCPDDEKMYLHRIGRTARAGESGKAITFAEFNEVDRLNVIRKKLNATDTEVAQVFSTSPELAERFTLPEARPWDHLSTSARSSGSGGGTRRESTAARGRDERPQQRRGRSDGRPKSERSQEGRGRDRDADRDRQRPSPAAETSTRTAPGATSDTDRDSGDATSRPDRADRGDRPAASAADRSERGTTSGEQPAQRTRSRTRTRARTAAAGAGGAATGEPARTSTAPETSDGGGSTSTGDEATRGRATSDEPAAKQGGSPGRTRARARKATGDAGSRSRPAGEDAPRRGAKGRDGRSRSGHGAEQPSRGSQPRNRGTRDDRSGRSGGGDRNTGGKEGDEATTSTTRGAEARGEGQPQRSRRVRVEHLP
ncbi:MAG: DEAD/DEAH box helicase [Nitriliruptor sp.]|nr:MAG: DEAD/DEAH box helicase [Nitriliruptor sp.]